MINLPDILMETLPEIAPEIKKAGVFVNADNSGNNRESFKI